MKLPISVLADRSDIPASTWRRWISEGRLEADLVKGVLHIDAKAAIRLAKRRENRQRLPSGP